MNFRFTISGGLEDLAYQEIQACFPCRLFWIQKGHSGSQLGVEIDEASSVNDSLQIPEALLKLRFVEYVYFVVHSQDLDEADHSGARNNNRAEAKILSLIRTHLRGAIQPVQLQVATTLGRLIQEALKDRSVGLEPLPGELLPTPALEAEESFVMDQPGSMSFMVNTIYTKPAVAKVVVESFVKLVEKYLFRIHQDESARPIMWLDAGAGSGALLQFLPGNRRLGIDITPATPEVVQANFLETTPEWLHEHFTLSDAQEATICVISNPPFADGSRGDYSPIVHFLNHAIDVLKASYVALIVPANFSRMRIWASLEMTPKARLLARFVLPQDSFVNPSNQKSVNIQSNFLFFGTREQGNEGSLLGCKPSPSSTRIGHSFYLHGKRDKGDFPGMATADLVQATALGLSTTAAEQPSSLLRLACDREAEFPLLVKLHKGNSNRTARLELWLLLNPERPLSLANSMSCLVHRHSLGWMSTSVKPAVANAILETTLRSQQAEDDLLSNSRTTAMVINAMCGEGTIDLEAQRYQESSQGSSFFLLSGDKSEVAARRTQKRLLEFKQHTGKHVLVDMVVWDAQRLPLRRDVADLFLADLPIAGSRAKKHQVPTASARNGEEYTATAEAPLDYRTIMANAVRVLRPLGKAALISLDHKTLVHHATASGRFHWRRTDAATRMGLDRVNLGGLNAQLLVLQKLLPCTKDLSVWVDQETEDLSGHIFNLARECTRRFVLDDLLELQESQQSDGEIGDVCPLVLVKDVCLVDEYHHEKRQRLSQCYRITLDGLLTNFQCRKLEILIRESIEARPPKGITGLR